MSKVSEFHPYTHHALMVSVAPGGTKTWKKHPHYILYVKNMDYYTESNKYVRVSILSIQ